MKKQLSLNPIIPWIPDPDDNNKSKTDDLNFLQNILGPAITSPTGGLPVPPNEDLLLSSSENPSQKAASNIEYLLPLPPDKNANQTASANSNAGAVSHISTSRSSESTSLMVNADPCESTTLAPPQQSRAFNSGVSSNLNRSTNQIDPYEISPSISMTRSNHGSSLTQIRSVIPQGNPNPTRQDFNPQFSTENPNSAGSINGHPASQMGRTFSTENTNVRGPIIRSQFQPTYLVARSPYSGPPPPVYQSPYPSVSPRTQSFYYGGSPSQHLQRPITPPGTILVNPPLGRNSNLYNLQWFAMAPSTNHSTGAFPPTSISVIQPNSTPRSTKRPLPVSNDPAAQNKKKRPAPKFPDPTRFKKQDLEELKDLIIDHLPDSEETAINTNELAQNLSDYFLASDPEHERDRIAEISRRLLLAFISFQAENHLMDVNSDSDTFPHFYVKNKKKCNRCVYRVWK